MKKVVLLLSIIFYSCDTEFNVPKAEEDNSSIEATTTLNSITAGLDNFEENIITFSEDLIIEAYVVSSDKSGNFFKELILQDAPENPTTGIALQIDEANLFERFPFGSKILINLNGLSIAYQNGVIELGTIVENSIDALSQFLIDEHVFRTGEISEIIPIEIEPNTITAQNLCLFTKLENMQFDASLLEPTPKTLAAEFSDSFDGLRPMLNCSSEVEIQLSTSVFANFKQMTLPLNSGSITGVLLRDFDDLHYVLVLNDPTGIEFENEIRCEPTYFDCTQEAFENESIIFQQDFESITNENLLEPDGWININVTGDEDRWTDKKITNIDNRVLTISAFNSGLQPLNAWLILPEFEILEGENINFSCRLRTLFNNGDALKLWVTNEYTGDPTSTNWQQFQIDLPNITSNYITVDQNIACLTGTIRIAFEYKGYDSVLTSTYDIDDIIITKETE